MRKLFVLALVCSLASMASASVILQPSKATVAAGETITLSIVTTAGEVVKGMTIGLISDGGAGGTAVAGSLNGKFVNGADAGYDGATLGLATAGDIGYISGAVDLPNYATGTLYTYSYTVSSLAKAGSMINFTLPNTDGDPFYFGTAVTLSNSSIVEVAGTSLTVIPEPATMALLGLGGLFFARKK